MKWGAFIFYAAFVAIAVVVAVLFIPETKVIFLPAHEAPYSLPAQIHGLYKCIGQRSRQL